MFFEHPCANRDAYFYFSLDKLFWKVYIDVKNLRSVRMMKKNPVVSFDWLTFTIPDGVFESLSQLVGDLFRLSLDAFVPARGRYGYCEGVFYENITILTKGTRAFMGTCFDISGKGVSYLYSLDYFSFEELFKLINSLGGSISRLDVALDCFNNDLDYEVMAQAVAVRNFASLWKTVKVIHSYNVNGVGFDLQFGSRRSDCMLRIYDKKVESGNKDLDYWCRLEIQFRHDLAHAFADTFLNRDADHDFTSLFIGFLSHHLRFIERKYGYGNSDKCPVLAWWVDFIENMSQNYDLTILKKKDRSNYTIESLIYNVRTRFSQSYRAFLELFGADALIDLLSNVEIKNRDYNCLVADYRKMKEDYGSVMTHTLYNDVLLS